MNGNTYFRFFTSHLLAEPDFSNYSVSNMIAILSRVKRLILCQAQLVIGGSVKAVDIKVDGGRREEETHQVQHR